MKGLSGARLADARFFYTADCDEPLDSFLPQLETVTFQEELGTMLLIKLIGLWKLPR
jgi:glycyl-tRNA synthetase beta subunit